MRSNERCKTLSHFGERKTKINIAKLVKLPKVLDNCDSQALGIETKALDRYLTWANHKMLVF